MTVSKIGPDSLPVFPATFVRNCLSGEEPPPVEGFFTSCAEPKRATFHWNPSNQFSKKPFLISNSVENFPNLSFYKSCDVVFSVGRATPYNLSPNPTFKKITVFSSEACPPPELIEPLTGSFSPEVFHSLCQAPLFNTHIVVGVPENAFVPSLSFSDYNFLNKNSALSWPAIEKKVHAKYLSLSKSAPEDGEEKKFLNRIEQHRNNSLSGSKSVLLVPGIWENFGFQEALSLAETILSESKFLVFIAVSAHPLSTLENAHEINPRVCGNFFFSCMESRYFCDTPLGLGEQNLGGEIEYNFARSAKKFFFCKMKKKASRLNGPEAPEMFVRPSPCNFTLYHGTEKKTSGPDQFLLVSVEKKQRKILDSLPVAGVFSKIFPDPDSVSFFFTSAQLYSPEFTVEKAKVFELLSSARARETEPLTQNLLCSSQTLLEPCSPSGLNRVIKLGRLDALRLPEHRSSIFVILDRLRLVSDVFPVSRYCYKICLAVGGSEETLIKALKDFNQGMGKKGPLFHSIFHEKDTRSLLLRALTPPRVAGAGWGRPVPRKVSKPSPCFAGPTFSNET